MEETPGSKSNKKHVSFIFVFQNCVYSNDLDPVVSRTSRQQKKTSVTRRLERGEGGSGRGESNRKREHGVGGGGAGGGGGGGRGGRGGRRNEMVREESGDRNRDGGVRAEQGEAKGRGGEENTVNNGTSAEMPGKLEGEKWRGERRRRG